MRFNFFVRFILKTISAFSVNSINGLSNIPKKRTFLIVSNHESAIDPYLISNIFSANFDRKVHYIARIGLFKSSFNRFFLNMFEAVPIDFENPKIAIQKGVDYLKKNELVAMFPEGWNNVTYIKRAKTGAVRLALGAEVPILPIGIINSNEIISLESKFPKKVKKIIKITIGKPIKLDRYYKKDIDHKMLREIIDKVMVEISHLTKKEYKV